MEDTTGGAGIEEIPGTGPIDYARAELIARRIAASRLGGVAREGIEVEDVVQDVLVRLVATDKSELRNWEAWVSRVTVNRCNDVLAAKLLHGNEPLPEGLDTDAPIDEATRIATRVMGPSAAGMGGLMVQRVLASLSPRERAVLLAQESGYTNAEIAERLGYASGRSVAVVASRAKAKVRAAFQGDARQEIVNPVRVY
jgi:RNA polymerase sigma factor (sigma-70 family)